MSDKTPDVTSAYALKNADDRRRLYSAWAATYDDDFAATEDYVLPRELARVFVENAGEGPVLDAGAGTGLVAQALKEQIDVTMDAFDLSAEMLAVARNKQFYRNLIEGDLTKQLPFADGTYNAVVSAGTFTHGHVGPEPLDELLRIAAPGALFVLTIKSEHFESHGFAGKFTALGPQIQNFTLVSVPIYGQRAAPARQNDYGLIALFRLA